MGKLILRYIQLSSNIKLLVFTMLCILGSSVGFVYMMIIGKLLMVYIIFGIMLLLNVGYATFSIIGLAYAISERNEIRQQIFKE